MAGLFLSFDGVDGVGKTTQMDRLCQWLRQLGHDVVRCRDPGGTKLGEAIRSMLLDHSELAISQRSEMLLYMASRAQLVEEVIRPALDAGKTVVSDRFLLANVVYQGHAGGLDEEDLWQVGKIATGGLAPDQTILLDMDAETAARRMARDPDRMEARGLGFLQRVRQGFLTEATRQRTPITRINANQSIDQVQSDIRAAVRRVLAR